MPGSAAIGNLAVNLSLETAAFSDGASKAQLQMRGLAGAAGNLSRGFGGFNSSANSARIVGLELAHVTRSLGEQLAMGVSPARAFASEIARIATAVQYAGGVGGLGRMIAGLIAPFASAAAGAGILAAAFLGVKQAADDTDLKAYIATLGLTDEQIKKLKNTTVTWGDVTKATFQVLAEKAGTSAAAISGHFSSAFKSVGDFGKFAASVLLASFGAMVEGVHALIVKLPAIVGGAFTAAVNLAIAALEQLVNSGVAAVNSLSSGINSALGTSIGQIAEVHLPRLQSNFGATMRAIGTDVSGTFHRIFNQTEATFDQISARAVKLRENDLADQAAALRSSDAAGRAAKGHEARARAVKHEADELARLHDIQLKVSDDITKGGGLSDFTKQSENFLNSFADNTGKAFDQAIAPMKRQQEALLSIADQFGAAIASVATGTESLRQAFADMARSIIADIIRMTVKMLIFRALSSAFGFQGSIVGSSGGGVDMSAIYGGGDLPGFASGGSFQIGGFGGVDQNVLGLNGSPIAKVSRGEAVSVGNPANSNGRVVIELRDDMLDARIATGANVQIVRTYPAMKADVMEGVRQQRRRAP